MAQRTCAIVATLTTAVWHERRDLRRLRRTASGLEVRADLTGDPDLVLLRGLFDGELTYSLRSVAYGGAFAGGAEERQRCLLAAAGKYDLVELELDRDLTPELLAAIPPHRRRICWYGKGLGPAGLDTVFARMVRTPAALYVLAPEAETVEQAMAPPRWLARLGRADVTAFATGSLGVCSRVLAPWFGAPVVFGGLGREVAWGVPPVEHLLGDYPFPALPAVEQVFGIVSRPMRLSLSPRLHNAAYRALGLPALYLPLPANEFPGSWRALCAGFEQLGLTFGGATVVAPFKEEALRLADTASVAASRTDAANLLVREDCGWRPHTADRLRAASLLGRGGDGWQASTAEPSVAGNPPGRAGDGWRAHTAEPGNPSGREGGGWRAHTTDPIGIVGALRRAGVRIAGRKVAVVGCGGAGRGAADGLLRAGAVPTIVNRGRDRGRYAADLLGVAYLPLARFAPENYSIVVHATPVRDEPPFAVDRLTRDAVVVDLAYGQEPTRLATAVRARNGVVVDGWRVLEVEVDRQFRLLTGQPMPAVLDGVPAVPPQREFAK